MGPCERCDEPGRDRHHIDGDTFNNDASNIMILCRGCHQLIDGRREIIIANVRAATSRARAATHCKQGHEFSPENTYVYPNGRRKCRICIRSGRRAWDRARKETAA